MTREEKVEVVKDLTELLSRKPNVYLTDAGGLTVAQMNELRELCFKAEVELRVVKNTLLKKAMEASEPDYTEVYPSLKQQTSVFFVAEKIKEPAKILKKFRGKKEEKPALKAAYIDGSTYVGDQSLAALEELKSKDEMIADVIALLQAPMMKVLGQLNSGGNTITGVLKTLEERAEA
ncbi:MAG: 50S ribosomal protein L10 [Bacteroidota bacterium]